MPGLIVIISCHVDTSQFILSFVAGGAGAAQAGVQGAAVRVCREDCRNFIGVVFWCYALPGMLRSQCSTPSTIPSLTTSNMPPRPSPTSTTPASNMSTRLVSQLLFCMQLYTVRSRSPWPRSERPQPRVWRVVTRCLTSPTWQTTFTTRAYNLSSSRNCPYHQHCQTICHHWSSINQLCNGSYCFLLEAVCLYLFKMNSFDFVKWKAFFSLFEFTS